MADVLNNDITAAYNDINRYIEELHKSQSSSAAEMKSYDKKRLYTYLSNMRFQHDFIVSQPEQDLPETSPKTYALRALPDTPPVENEMINHLIGLLALTRDELINSQSARDSSGMKKFDSDRFLMHVMRIEVYMKDFVENVSPVDLPESSPRVAVSGPGLGGI